VGDQTGRRIGDVTIRVARPDDLALLLAVEQAAGQPFRSLGMDLVADDNPGTVEALARYAECGRAFVSADAHDRPVAYLLLAVVDA
jgi:hypothetical protein